MSFFGPITAALLMGKIASMDQRSALGWGLATAGLDALLYACTDWGGFFGDGASCIAIFIAMAMSAK